MKLFARQKERQEVENKCMDTKGGKRGGMNWDTGVDIYTLVCVDY